MAITRSEYEAYKAKSSAGSSSGTGAGSSGSGSGSGAGGIGRSAYEAYKEKLRKREEEAAAEREERKKIEAEVERLRLMRKNAATQSRINAQTREENAAKAVTNALKAYRENERYARVASHTAYTDTGSSRDSWEDRQKRAEVEANPETRVLKAYREEKARRNELEFAYSDRAASRHFVTDGDVKRFVYEGKKYSVKKLAEKLGTLTEDELKERSEVPGLTKGQLKAWAEKRAERDQASTDYRLFVNSYNYNPAETGQRVKTLREAVWALDDLSDALNEIEKTNPALFNEIDGIAQFLHGGPKAKRYGEAAEDPDGTYKYMHESDAAARQDAYKRMLLQKCGFKTEDELRDAYEELSENHIKQIYYRMALRGEEAVGDFIRNYTSYGFSVYEANQALAPLGYSIWGALGSDEAIAEAEKVYTSASDVHVKEDLWNSLKYQYASKAKRMAENDPDYDALVDKNYMDDEAYRKEHGAKSPVRYPEASRGGLVGQYLYALGGAAGGDDPRGIYSGSHDGDINDKVKAMTDDEKDMLVYLAHVDPAFADKWIRAFEDNFAYAAAMNDPDTNVFERLWRDVKVGLGRWKRLGEKIFGNERRGHTVDEIKFAANQENADSAFAKGAHDIVQNMAFMAPALIVSRAAGGIAGAMGASSATSMMVTSATNALSIGLVAGADAKQNAINQGYSAGDAAVYGLLVGTSEAALEKILGSRLVGGGVWKNIEDVALRKINNALLRFTVRLGAAGLSEFSEEYLQNRFELVFRNICFDEKNEIRLFSEDALYEGLIGFFSGVALSGYHAARTTVTENNIGKLVDVDTAVREGNRTGNEEVDELIRNLGSDPSDAKKGALAYAISAAKEEGYVGNAKRIAAEAGVDQSVLIDIAKGNQLSPEMVRSIFAAPKMISAVEELTGMDLSSENIRGLDLSSEDGIKGMQTAFAGWYDTNVSPLSLTFTTTPQREYDAKRDGKTLDKTLKKIDKFVSAREPGENAAYEAAMQTTRSETVGAEYTEGLRGAENYALSPDFGRETATAPVSQESSEAAVTIPAQTETNAPTVTNVPADTGSPEVSPSDNENVITVKRAKVSEPAKAVGRITKNGKAIEGGGRYYVYDSDAASVVRYDEAPQNVSFTGDDALAGRLDRVLNTEGSDTGTVFYPEKVADLKTAINTIKRIKTAYGDKGAAVAYNFGDGIVVDATKVLDVVEALPDAAVQRVPVGNGYYGLKFVSDSGVGFVMPINATDVSVAEDSVFLIRSRNAPASASVVLGNNSWSPAEGESPIPAKSSARVFNDDLTFNLADDTLTEGAQLEKSEKPVDKKRYSFKSPADTTAHELLRPYTAEERAFIEENDGVVIDSYETLDREVRRTIEDPKTTGSLYFGFIDNSVIPEIEKKISNLPRIFNGHLFNDTKKYSLVVERGVIRHFKRKRGFNLTQTIEYIDKYAPTVLESDTISFDYYRKRGNNTPALLFTKNFGDGNVVFFDLVSGRGRLSLQTMYIKRKSSAMAAASAAATTAENTAVTTPEAMVDQTFYENRTTKGTKSQGFSEENTADFEKVRKSAEETSEKVRNIPERVQNEGKTTARRAAAKENTEAAVKKRGGRNVFRDESGEYREIAGISDDGAVILDGSAELDVDSLDDETRSAVDTILADLYSGRITEAEAVNMLRNGTLAYVKGDASWYAEELNDGNTAELMSPQMTEKLIGKLFGVYFNYGRVKRKGAMGFMKQGEKTIRTRTVGMLPTVCHELTHVFDFTMGKDLRSLPGINEVIKAAPQSWLNQYAVSKHASEATAWFGEQYFRSRKAAQKISPEFFRNFEAAFTKSELAKLHEVSDVVNRYMAYERDADGNIDTTATLMKQQREQLTSERDDRDMRSFKDKVKGLFRRQETGWFNANAIFENRFGDDASVLYNANIISGAARATYMIKGTDGLVRKGRHSGGFDTASGKHIDDLQTILSPLEEIMKTDNEAYRDFNLYLTALRGGTKVLQGKRVFASDVANRPAEIQKVIDRLESAHPEFKEIAKNAIEFHRELVKKMCVDTGLMSREKYEQMSKDDPFYVPFRRDVETSSGVPFTKGFLKTEQRYKRMKGSGRDIYNPVESLFQDAYDTVVSSLKAQYGDFILNKVDTDPAGWEWLASNVNAKVNMDVTDLTKQRDAFESELKAAGLDQQAVDAIMNIFDGTVGDEVRDFSTPYYQGEQYFLRVRWEDQGDGTQKRVVKCYQFNDPYAADTMKNAIDNSVSMNSKAMNGLLAVSKFRKIFLTGSSPLFTVRNLIRDAQDAYAYGRISNPVKFVVEYAKAIKSVISGDEAYMRYKEAGGGNSTRLSNDINTVADLIPTVYKAHTKESVRVIRRMLRFAPDMISRANETIEQVPRMMAFKYALEQGFSEEQALFDAANITVNFGQHGAKKGAITTLGGVFPFFNAGVQGRYRMYQALKTDPATFLAKKTVTAVVRVGLLTGLIKAFGLEDEYKKLSNYIKNNYYVIPIGKNSFIRLPKDREGGVLDSLIENAVSSLMYGTDGEQWYDYATYLIDQFGGPGTLESLLGYGLEVLHDGDSILGVISGVGSDTVLSPIFDIIRNEDYRGVKVENATDQKKVRSERYDETTSSTGKLLGKLGLLSPKQWDHLFKSLGFIPAAVLALPENFAEGGVFGPVKNVGETFRSAFTSSSVYSNDAVNDFYDNFEKLELKKNSKDSGGIRAEYAKASGVKQVITELYSMRRAAQSEDEREALTRIIRDTAYDYMHGEKKTDNVARWTEELYDELGGGSDYTFLFPTAPKAVIKADGVEYSLDLLTYLDYVDEYESAMNDAYFRIFVDHTKDSAEDQAKYLKEAKEETEAALKRKYMLKATPSSEKITTDYLKGQIANGYADSGTLKKYVDQERKTREDKGIMQTLANIYKNEYKVAKKSGNNALARHIEDVLVGLGVGFTAEKIRKWA